MLAHIGGVPVEESLLYLAPVIFVVSSMYVAGWRERRRNHGRAAHQPPARPSPRRQATHGRRRPCESALGAASDENRGGRINKPNRPP